MGFRQMCFEVWRLRGMSEDAVQARWIEYVRVRPALAKKYHVVIPKANPQPPATPTPQWDGKGKRSSRRRR